MLELRGISKRFGQRVAADGLSLEVAAGETLALLGPSGCGKSTLLKIIAGLLPADGGSVRFAGEDITRLPPEKRGFALMFQDFALFPHLNVLGNVLFGLAEQGRRGAKATASAEAALARLGLADYGGRKVWTLSGGEQQRVALARALVTQPRLLLLDEPFSSLDAHLRGQLRQEFSALLAEAGIPAVLVTHDRDEAFAMARRVAVLNAGRVAQCATPQDLLAAPASAWLARFIGYRNVLDDAVAPEHALLLDDAYPPARITALTRLAEGVSLTLDSRWGSLQLTLSAREAHGLGERLRLGGSLGLALDESALLRFPGDKQS